MAGFFVSPGRSLRCLRIPRLPLCRRPPLAAEAVLGAFCRHVHQPLRHVRLAVPDDLSHTAGPLARPRRLGGQRFGVGALCGSTLGGWLARSHRTAKHDRARHFRRGALCHAALSRATSLPAIIVCTALAGLASGTYHPAASALLADIVPGRSARARLRSHPARRQRGLRLRRGDRRRARELFALLALRRRCAHHRTLRLHRAVLPAARPARANTQTRRGAMRLRQLRAIAPSTRFGSAAFLSALVFAQFGSTYSLHVIRRGLTFDALRLPPRAGDRLWACSSAGTACSSCSPNCR